MLREHAEEATEEVCPGYVRNAVESESRRQHAECFHAGPGEYDCPDFPNSWSRHTDSEMHALWSQGAAASLGFALEQHAEQHEVHGCGLSPCWMVAVAANIKRNKAFS